MSRAGFIRRLFIGALMAFAVVFVLNHPRTIWAAEVELEGLDMPEMGALGYPGFVQAGPRGALTGAGP